jgi:hypothetical protein
MRTAKTTPDGRAIADRKPNAKVPHPHPRHNGELVETQGVNEIMLEDGTVLTECDECGKAFENPRSAVAHMPSHNPDRRGPRYPDRTLRLIARQVAMAGGSSKQGALSAVAVFLNEQGVKMVKGGDWTAGAVGHVYHKYCKDLRVRIPRSVGVVVPGETAVPVLDPDLATLAKLVGDTAEGLGAIGAQLVEGAESLATVARTLADMATKRQDADPELAEKARKWDQFRAMMGD